MNSTKLKSIMNFLGGPVTSRVFVIFTSIILFVIFSSISENSEFIGKNIIRSIVNICLTVSFIGMGVFLIYTGLKAKKIVSSLFINAILIIGLILEWLILFLEINLLR